MRMAATLFLAAVMAAFLFAPAWAQLLGDTTPHDGNFSELVAPEPERDPRFSEWLNAHHDKFVWANSGTSKRRATKMDSLRREFRSEVKRLDGRIDCLKIGLNGRVNDLKAGTNGRIDSLRADVDGLHKALRVHAADPNAHQQQPKTSEETVDPFLIVFAVACVLAIIATLCVAVRDNAR